MTRGQMIVLANDGSELVAAACLTTSGRGHLAFLVVDPDVADVEALMCGAAAAA